MYKKLIYLNNIYISSLLSEIINDSVFFDIETTGLNIKSNNIISLSALTVSSGKFAILQCFSESNSDEELVLKEFTSFIECKEYLISYNGNSFDIPFIKAKLQKYKINFKIDKFKRNDLFIDLRNLKYKLNITNLKLKTVESYFNIYRKDELSGKDIIKIYTSYIKNNKEVYRDLILQHNYEDVLYLPQIFNNVLDLYDFTMYYNYQESKTIIKLKNNNISFYKNLIVIKLNIDKNYNIDYVNYNSYYEVLWKNKEGYITIKLKPYNFKNDSIGSLIYLLNEEFEIKEYDKLEGIRDDIVPLKHENNIYYKNIHHIVKTIIELIE